MKNQEKIIELGLGVSLTRNGLRDYEINNALTKLEEVKNGNTRTFISYTIRHD